MQPRKYTGTYNSIKTLTFDTVEQPKVQKIFDLILDRGRDRFKFAGNKEGCRHWVYTMISDMEAAGLIRPESSPAAWDILSKYWRIESGSDERPVEGGTFL